MVAEHAEANAIIVNGASMPSRQAMEFFFAHQKEADMWPQDYKRRFYYQWGAKVAQMLGKEAAYPFYVRSLAAETPVNKLNGAWLEFDFYTPDENKTDACVRELSARYPLDKKYIKTCMREADKTHTAAVTAIRQLVSPDSDEAASFAYARLADGTEICVKLPLSESECGALERLIPGNRLSIEVQRDTDWKLKRIIKK
jgi:hypothetical protein